MFCCRFPSPLQFGARHSGFSFLGSGGNRRKWSLETEVRRKKSEERINKTGDKPGAVGGGAASTSGGCHGTRPDTQGCPGWELSIWMLPLPRTPEPRRQLPGAGAQPVRFGDGRRTFGMSSPTYPGLAQRRPNAGIQPVKLKPDLVCFWVTDPGTPESG